MDPYGNEMPRFASSISGAKVIINNDLGASYNLTVTSNLITQVQIGDTTIITTGQTVKLLNGCYTIIPEKPTIEGIPWIIDYMENIGTGVKFPGVDSLTQCLHAGPATTHVEYKPIETDFLVKTYQTIDIWYYYRPARLDPHNYYAKVAGHGKWFNIHENTLQDVQDWIDKELEEPEPETAEGSITGYDAPSSETPGDTVTVSATAKNVGAASGSFRFRLTDRDTNVEVDSTSWFTLTAGGSTTKTLSGVMPDKDWNLKLILERTLPTGAVTVDDEKKFTAVNIVDWWTAFKAWWNGLTRWQKALLLAGTAGGTVIGGTTLYKARMT